ncbi:MAG: hypothetical protein FJ206_01875 [Gemmatimonadetes bacterium]|nr:hypothetical protein [Gemmatimonadota bacterium]
MKPVIHFLTTAGIAVAALGGCQATTLPVPVRGTVEPLVGEWAGEYVSPETGRSGSIVFSLAAGRDTAFGDVLMVPANVDIPAAARSTDPTSRPPRVLQISFVRCEGNAVTGWLDPYPDPDTGENTATTFDGIIKGDKLEGTFVSYLERSGVRRTGKWSVHRKAVK